MTENTSAMNLDPLVRELANKAICKGISLAMEVVLTAWTEMPRSTMSVESLVQRDFVYSEIYNKLKEMREKYV